MLVHDYCTAERSVICLPIASRSYVKHVTSTTRCNILDPIFTITDYHTLVYFGGNFPGSDLRVVHGSIQIRASLPTHFIRITYPSCSNWRLLPSPVRQLDWGRFFLMTEPKGLQTNSIPRWSATFQNWSSTRIHNFFPLKRNMLSYKSNFHWHDFSKHIILHRLSHTILCLCECFLQKEEIETPWHQNQFIKILKPYEIRSSDGTPVVHFLILPDGNFVIKDSWGVKSKFCIFHGPAIVRDPPKPQNKNSPTLSAAFFDVENIARHYLVSSQGLVKAMMASFPCSC